MARSEETDTLILEIRKILDDPAQMAAADKRFAEISAKWPQTELDRIIARSKEIQEWDKIKNLRITI